MIEAGRVRINGRLARKAAQTVAATDEILVADPPAAKFARNVAEWSQKSGPCPPGAVPAARPGGARASRAGVSLTALAIVHEDPDLLVVNKPPGLLTSTVPREKRLTLLALVRDYVAANDSAARVGLIHRLDRDASGLLVFSKNHDAYRSLKQQFFDHTVERVYTAIVRGVPTPPAGRIESRLVERADGTVYSTPRHGTGEHAVTDYETVESRRGRSVLRVKLHTGRKHQIRVHLSERGVPIVGDPMYFSKDRRSAEPAPRLLLAATRLSLTHPRSGKPLTFEVPPPKEFGTA
jgi:RluA family pseudouridine synthase